MLQAVTASPTTVVAFSPQEGLVVLRVAPGAASRTTVLGAAHALIDRAWVLLDREDEGGLLVRCRLKSIAAPEATADALRALADAFATALVTHGWRHELGKAHGDTIAAIFRGALA